MNRSSMAKTGSACSILAGVLLVVSGAAFFILAGHFVFSFTKSISEYFKTAPTASTILTVVNVGAAFASFLAVAGVLAQPEWVHSHMIIDNLLASYLFSKELCPL